MLILQALEISLTVVSVKPFSKKRVDAIFAIRCNLALADLVLFCFLVALSFIHGPLKPDQYKSGTNYIPYGGYTQLNRNPTTKNQFQSRLDNIFN